MTDAELHRQIARLADEFEIEGHVVSRHFEVDTRAAAQFLSYAVPTLRNLRSYGLGPAHRLYGKSGAKPEAHRAWYRIADLLAWRDSDASVIDSTETAGAESAPLDASDAGGDDHDYRNS